MSARAISSGTISFGLVTIPVKLYSTGESSTGISFNMLHAKCGSRLRQQYICPTDNEVVERDQMTKGFEYAKGQYVLFSDEEIAALTVKPTNTIEITEFVPLIEVDPIYFEKSYYLGPDKGGDRPYRLLAEAMRETGRAALARYAARGKDYLVLVRPFEQGLVMQQLRYADEIKAFSEVPVGAADVKPQELALAKQLVEQIASDEFRPEVYEDEVRKQIWDLIEKKAAGEEIRPAPQEAPKAQIVDLMQALKASLAAVPSPAAGPQAVPAATGPARKPPKPSPASRPSRPRSRSRSPWPPARRSVETGARPGHPGRPGRPVTRPFPD